MPRQVFGLGSRCFSGKGQWLALVGVEVLGYGGVSEMVAERRGTYHAQLCVEDDEAAVVERHLSPSATLSLNDMSIIHRTLATALIFGSIQICFAQLALDGPYINERFVLNADASILYREGVPPVMESHGTPLRLYALDEPYYWLNRVYFRVSLDENSALTERAPQDSILPLIDIINLGVDSDLVFYGDMGYNGPCDTADRRPIQASPFVLKVDFSYDYAQHALKSSITGISFEQADGRLVHLYFPELRWWLRDYKVRTPEGLIGCDVYFDQWLLLAHRTTYTYDRPPNSCSNCQGSLEEQGELDALTDLWLLEKELERSRVEHRGEQTFPVPSFGAEGAIGRVVFSSNGEINALEVRTAKRTFLSAKYENGKPQGLYERYNAGAGLQEQGQFHNGLREGTWTSWFADGQVRSVRQYANGLLHGQELVNHPNGRTYLKYDMVNGEYNGRHESYYPDGGPRASGQMADGFVIGRWTYDVRIDSTLRAYMDEGRHLFSFPASAWQDNTLTYTVNYWLEPSRDDCIFKRCQRWDFGDKVE